MAHIEYGLGNVTTAMASGADDMSINQNTITISSATVGGIGIVTCTWSDPIQCYLDGSYMTLAAGSIDLNAGHVASPTTYYVYVNGTTGVPVATVSITNPAIDGTVTEYFILAVVRFSSPAGTATILDVRDIGKDGMYRSMHNLKENALYSSPVWMSGMALSTAAGGKLSTTSGYIRYVGNAPISMAALTDEPIMLDDETSVVGLDNITTYSDGSPITAGKYHKLLIGIKRDTSATTSYRLVAIRQGLPTVEYVSAAAALADSERVAAVGFGTNYRFDVLPLYYYAMLKGDYTDYAQTDIRTSGPGSAGGAVGGVTDHGALAGLGDDDHAQYLLASGTRALTGDWDVGAHEIRAETFESDVATGTAPFTVASTTAVTNLNADAVDGIQGADILLKDGTVAMTGALDMGAKGITNAAGVATTTVTASGLAKALTFESTQATGTAPMVVASTTVVTNLNADKLDGNDATAFAVAAKGVTNGDTHDHAGGDGAQIDHGGLDGLADDDHTQYLLADGSRDLTGNLNVDALVTIDGVDISAHAANANAHHNAVTLGANTSGILSLSTQAISMATTVSESYVLAGPTYGVGGTAAPTFRALNTCDVKSGEGTLVLADGTNNDVALQDAVDQYTVSGPTAAFTITGFANGTPGRRIVILNPIAKAMTAAHQSADSVAANRIICPGAYADTATSGTGLMVFEYFGTTQRWVMISLIS